MSVKVTVPNGSSDYLTFGSANTPVAAQIGGYDDGSSAGHIEFYTTTSGTSTERMRIDASGNVGIGTSSPSVKLDLAQNTASDIQLKLTNQYTSAAYSTSLRLQAENQAGSRYNAFQSYYGNTLQWQISGGGSDSTIVFSNGSGATERMRIDSSGNVLVGTTSFATGQDSILLAPTSRAFSRSGTANAYQIQFANGNGYVGRIDTTGTATGYVTSSDYRLKENVAPIVSALEKVASLNPVTWTWKTDGTDGEGFIAHELAEICPQAVSGEKDAVDEEGNPVYQGVDTSFLVATLTAAIQELSAKVTALEAQLGAK